MRIQLSNQQRDPMPLAWLTRLTQRAAKALRVRSQGCLAITFIDRKTMRRLNRQFTRHDGLTDVLSFRYPKERIVGEILVAPAAARTYATHHGVPYRQELARYVMHGLLHWLGHEDRTPSQQRKMRRLEDELLMKCTPSKVRGSRFEVQGFSLLSLSLVPCGLNLFS